MAALHRAGLLTEVCPPTPAEEAVRDLCRARVGEQIGLDGAALRFGRACLASPATESAENPSSAAWLDQERISSVLSTSRFAARVISAARSASLGLSAGVPSSRSLIAVSISSRRVENAPITFRGTPAIWNRPFVCGFSIR